MIPARRISRGAVDVLEEKVERPRPLLQPARKVSPFLARHDAGDNVEGDQSLFGLGIAVDREGNADLTKKEFRLVAAVFQKLRWGRTQPAFEHPVGLSGHPAAAIHFIEDGSSTSPCGRSPPGSPRLEATR